MTRTPDSRIPLRLDERIRRLCRSETPIGTVVLLIRNLNPPRIFADGVADGLFQPEPRDSYFHSSSLSSGAEFSGNGTDCTNRTNLSNLCKISLTELSSRRRMMMAGFTLHPFGRRRWMNPGGLESGCTCLIRGITQFNRSREGSQREAQSCPNTGHCECSSFIVTPTRSNAACRN
jgi:hypothetical protein